MSFMKQCKQQLSQKRFHQQEKKHAVLTNREVNRTTRCWPSSYVFIAKFRLVNIHSVIGFNEVWLVSYAFVRQNVCFKS